MAAKAVAVRPREPTTITVPAATKPTIAILHFPDGVRVGPLVTSDCGLAQMPFHIDLTNEQLDTLCEWRVVARKKVAP